jgi:Zn-finger protein
MTEDGVLDDTSCLFFPLDFAGERCRHCVIAFVLVFFKCFFRTPCL